LITERIGEGERKHDERRKLAHALAPTRRALLALAVTAIALL